MACFILLHCIRHTMKIEDGSNSFGIVSSHHLFFRMALHTHETQSQVFMRLGSFIRLLCYVFLCVICMLSIFFFSLVRFELTVRANSAHKHRFRLSFRWQLCCLDLIFDPKLIYEIILWYQSINIRHIYWRFFWISIIYHHVARHSEIPASEVHFTVCWFFFARQICVFKPKVRFFFTLSDTIWL